MTAVAGAVAVNVLNASYQPLGATQLKRAMALVLRGDAVVEEADPLRTVRHAGGSFPWPLVIRLLRYVKVPVMYGDALWSKSGVLKRDGHRCGYCDKKADTVDHILPQSRGGKNTWENTVAACQPCNARKADHLLENTGMVLLITPSIPKRIYISAGKTHKKKVKNHNK
jgi:hypothetical protein